MTRTMRNGCEALHIEEVFLRGCLPPTVSEPIPSESDEFVEGIIAVLERRNLGQERRGRQPEISIFRYRHRDDRIIDSPKGPKCSGNIPRMRHDQRSLDAGSPQDSRRE